MNKTTIDKHNIDLRDVAVIGPLIVNQNSMTDRNEIKGPGCFLTLKTRDSLWLNMTEHRIDPYQLDDSKNAFARAEAQANYDQLVTQWKGAD